MPTILYLHGLSSRPGGVKPTYMKKRGYEIVNPHLPDEDFAESARRAQEAFDRAIPDVVVGSSRGGAVALNMDTRHVPIVLIAPAWRKWGTADSARPGTVILHAENDAVIPIAESRELIQRSGLPVESLIVVGIDHNMTDPDAFAALEDAVRRAVTRTG